MKDLMGGAPSNSVNKKKMMILMKQLLHYQVALKSLYFGAFGCKTFQHPSFKTKSFLENKVTHEREREREREREQFLLGLVQWL
jgi:hypothetical protein